MKIKAEIVGDSLSPQGNRLTTLLITFPRIILSEINTHRMLSKNTSSSRAIPFKKMVEAIQENPFIPMAWQKSHSGMQGNEYLIHTDANVEDWLKARDLAVQQAKLLNNSNVTKQLCNRLLEPFMWTTMLITGSKEGWNNFFSLRCPEYVNPEGKLFKSKKDYLKTLNTENIKSEPSDLFWLKRNKGQAEIHIMDLSEKIYDAMNESTPEQLQAGEYHIPMLQEEDKELPIDLQLKYAVGIHANTSYTVVGDGRKLTLSHAIKIHDKCKEEVHSSVFEHCARAMNDEAYYLFSKGMDGQEDHQHGWCYNIRGFMSYRYIIETK